MADQIKNLLKDAGERRTFLQEFFDTLKNDKGKITDDDVSTIATQIGDNLNIEPPTTEEIEEAKGSSGQKAPEYSFDEFVNKGSIVVFKAFAIKHNIEI